MADKRERPMNPFTGGYHSPAGEVIQEGIRRMQGVTETAKALFTKKRVPTPPVTPASGASITRNLDEARQLKQLEEDEAPRQFSGR